MIASHDNWTTNRSIQQKPYPRIKDPGHQDIIVIEVFPFPEKLFLVVLVADVGEFGWRTRIHCCLHVDDVANVPFVVLVISICICVLRFNGVTGKAEGSLWG